MITRYLALPIGILTGLSLLLFACDSSSSPEDDESNAGMHEIAECDEEKEPLGWEDPAPPYESFNAFLAEVEGHYPNASTGSASLSIDISKGAGTPLKTISLRCPHLGDGATVPLQFKLNSPLLSSPIEGPLSGLLSDGAYYATLDLSGQVPLLQELAPLPEEAEKENASIVRATLHLNLGLETSDHVGSIELGIEYGSRNDPDGAVSFREIPWIDFELGQVQAE